MRQEYSIIYRYVHVHNKAHFNTCFICISGNQEILDEVNGTIDFSYVRILKLMYAQDDVVRLLAGSALAAFAFNNISQQKEIAQQGGVRFNCFVPFLQSSDESYRCNAAFQVIMYYRFCLCFSFIHPHHNGQ